MQEVSEEVYVPVSSNPLGFSKLEKQVSTVLPSAFKLTFPSDMPN